MTNIQNTKKMLMVGYSTKDKNNITHTFMDGGNLHIPVDKLPIVYELLEKNKSNPPLTERVTAYGNYFKFFIDYDDDRISIETIVNKVFEQLDNIFILTEEQKKYCIYKNNEKEKYHIIFNFKVNIDDARILIDNVEKSNDNLTIDKSVYTSGLRLPSCIKKGNDKSIYELYAGKAGLLNSSIIYVEDMKDTVYHENLINFKNSEFFTNYKNNNYVFIETDLQEDKYTQECSPILDKIFNIEDGKWRCTASNPYTNQRISSYNSYKFICLTSTKCLVDDGVIHTEGKHSCLYMNKYCTYLTCFSHGNKKIKMTTELKKLKDILYPKNKEELKKITLSNIPITLIDDDILKMTKSLNTTHDDVARIFHYFYKDMFICGAEIPTPQWYVYKKGIWEELDGNSIIREKICREIAIKYLELRDVLLQNAIERTNDSLIDFDIAKLESMASLCDEIIIKLKSVAYVDALMKQCIYMFKVEKFIEKLDGNGYLLCFGEDVYDLEINEWRKTQQTDYCSRKCGMSKEDITDEHLDELNEILNNIFINENRRHYFLNLTAEVLHGGNLKEIFQIWTGTGRNGKGLFMKYLEKALGSYFYTSDVSYLTQKTRPNGNANSELAQSRGIRVWSFTEPAQGAKLNNSLMKAITGGDIISARQLFQKSFTFLPQFTPIIQCNTSFGLQDVADDSIPDRLEFIKFNTRFVSEPTKSFERLKLVGIKTDKYANKIKGTLMFLLLNRWRELSKVDFKYTKPEEVVGDKQEFIDDNDDIKQFFDDTYEITDNQDDFLKAKDMFDSYKEYFNDKSGFKCKMNLKTFITRCSKHVEHKERHKKAGIDHRNIYLNIKIKQE